MIYRLFIDNVTEFNSAVEDSKRFHGITWNNLNKRFEQEGILPMSLGIPYRDNPMESVKLFSFEFVRVTGNYAVYHFLN